MTNLLKINLLILRELIEADFKTGILTWLQRPQKYFRSAHSAKRWNTKNAGKRALASLNKGSYRGTIFKTSYLAHRVIWALYYGRWPKKQIDHINGNPSDNRIENLRDVSQQENSKNAKLRTDNTSGHVGVYWQQRDNVWIAYISIDKKPKALGRFFNKKKAIECRKMANMIHGYHPNHGRTE